MRRDEAIARLKAAETDIRAFGVANLYMFGSVARDEATAESDIDIFVDPGTDAFYSFRNFMGVYKRLVETFPGVEIGYCTRDGLSEYIREDVERGALRVF